MMLRKDLYLLLTTLKFKIAATAIASVLLIYTTISCQQEDEFTPLKIFSVEPAQAMVGDTIAIIGEGFSPGYEYNDISFQGISGSVKPLDNSTTGRLYVKVPDGVQSGTIHVNILDEETADSPPLTILVPVIDKIEPDHAWIGDTVTIKGNNFRSQPQTNSVRFNPKEVKALAAVIGGSSIELKVIVPPSARTGSISVLGYLGVSFTLNTGIIASLEPGQGVVGDTIALKGKGLNTSADVTIYFTGDNASGNPLPESTSRDLKVVVPPGATDGTLKIEYDDIEIVSDILFEVYPSVTDIFPRSGLTGATIKITGYNFSSILSENKVKFNGIDVAVTKATERELQVKLPAGITSGPVTVDVNGRLATGPSFTLSAAGTPVVFELQPNRGPVLSTVVIKGENFSTVAAQNEVRFSNNKLATVTSATATELIVRVPEGAESGPISVTKDSKTGTSLDFTIYSKLVPVITALNPGTIKRGATLTITGANFSAVKEDIGVTFTGNGASSRTPLTASENQLTVVVPSDISPGEWSISVDQSGETSNKDRKIIVEGQPAITLVTPTQGIPGATVALTGTDFDLTESNNIVKFGNTVATLVNAGDVLPDKVSVYIPDIAPGNYNITLTAFGKTSNAIAFSVKAKPATVRNVYYSAADDIVTSQAVLIKKAVFDPPATQTVYKTANAASVSSLVVDLANSKVYLDESGALIQSNLNNTGRVELFNFTETGGNGIIDLSLDAANQKIYWSGSTSIYRGNTDGSGTPELLFDTSDGLESIMGITYLPNNNKVYLADLNYTSGYQILQGNADGSGSLQSLFDVSDGLSYVLDVKIDYSSGKIFVLDANEATGEFRILSGDLDGTGSLTELKVLSASQVAGISLDTQEKYIYWIQASAADPQLADIYRARYDFSVIPGTDPVATIQTVYSSIKLGTSNYVGGLAVEESSGAAQRASLRLPLKLRKKQK
ncbi:IPT/TIG domain-containing protein [Ohtaekwangia koreensis]|uniref:IPT/TIG domain-containing protein n=1 Tax=Ohtaekwangia koreensis TaxID=688867 RepID=A0A1T5M4Z6_9BACT|nr:IPT/TIG domain-containing protein [Ohtaekwangia koreensis]SKC83213.1 IPT/TIG domain-containing protein [Ohtaekwangia koreensis]